MGLFLQDGAQFYFPWPEAVGAWSAKVSGASSLCSRLPIFQDLHDQRPLGVLRPRLLYEPRDEPLEVGLAKSCDQLAINGVDEASLFVRQDVRCRANEHAHCVRSA